MPPLSRIQKRLEVIFPDAFNRRPYLTREVAARTVWTLFYVGAVQGRERWMGPKHVYRMTRTQAALLEAGAREAYAHTSTAAGRDRWYADNSREQIRDETLRYGFLEVGAVVVRPGVATTAGTPRWAMAADFAALFEVAEAALPDAIVQWRNDHLSAAALARLQLARRGLTGQTSETVPVRLPSGTVRQLPHGVSSDIARAVVETFLPRFCAEPAVIWMSDSRHQVVVEDRELTNHLGLRIADTGVLPDLVAVDLSARAPVSPIFVFVEVVASEGPVDAARRTALLALLAAGRFPAAHARFVTAYWDRNRPEFRRTIGEVAWNGVVWFATEPECLLVALGPRKGAFLYEILPPE